jgi:hypothetical protein
MQLCNPQPSTTHRAISAHYLHLRQAVAGSNIAAEEEEEVAEERAEVAEEEADYKRCNPDPRCM